MNQQPLHEAARHQKMIIQNIPELDFVSLLHVNMGKAVLEIIYFKRFKLFAEGGGAEFRFLMNSTKTTIYTSYIIK